MPQALLATRRLSTFLFACAGLSLIACNGNLGTSGAGGSSGGNGSGAGGVNASMGGATGSGGATPGGSGGGGGKTSGGTGGTTSAGSGGAPMTGAGGAGARDAGPGPGSTDAGMTAGCGAATWPMGGTASPQMLDVTAGGTTMSRQVIFALPAGYTSGRAYRVVFAWHYAGGTAATIAGTGGGGIGRFYGLQPLMADTIFIAPQGLMDSSGRTGWPNTGGQDVAFARAMVDWTKSNFCVDTTRIMSTGFSYGAIMSHTVACQMSDVFRAVGLMAGALIGRANACLAHPIAAWMTHGTADTAAIGGVDFAQGEAARDRVVALNHCAATTQPTTPSPCVAYDGCDSGDPVVWCPVQDEMHAIPPFAASAIAAFFAQF